MRPMSFALALAAVAALLPAVSLAQAAPPVTCAEQGGFLFVDKKSFEFNTSCSDAEGVAYCLSGRDNPIDAEAFPNRLVQFDWFSNGSVTKSSDSATKGEFSTVTLTLSIIAIRGPTAEPLPGNHCMLWQSETADFPCKLTGGTRKSNTRSRVRLQCELGANLSGLVPAAGFGPLSDPPLAQPTSTQTLLQSVESAFLKRKTMKLDVKTGRLKVNQKGVGAPTDFQSVPDECAASPGSCLLCPALPPDPSLPVGQTAAPLCRPLPPP